MNEQTGTNKYRYCLHCMTPVTQVSGACPHCGHEVSGTYTVGTIRPGSMLHYNQYLVGDVIGQGGFGITYIGEDIGLGIPVAIKEFFPNGSATRDNRTSTVYGIGIQGENAVYSAGKNKFLQEAKNLARFSGTPGIVDVKSVFEENNTAYIVMQYISGKTLNEYVNAGGIIPERKVLEIIHPVMQALKKIHSRNLIHRDISPDNLKFNEETLTLIDFGSARLETSESNKSLSVVVKHGFAPIEQYQSHGEQGPWTDIYALCATIYWSVTGKLPSAAPDRVIKDGLKKPSELGISLTPAFENALMKGLAFRPDDRYQSINDLMADMYKIDEKAEAARKANEARIAREKQAEAERQERERKAEALRIEREKKAEEERKQRAQREEQLRIEKEKKAEAERLERQKREEARRLAEQKKEEQRKLAEQQKAEKLRKEQEARAERERKAKEARVEKQRTAQEKKAASSADTNKNKKWPAVMAAVLVIAVAAGIVLAKIVIPKQRTEKAYQNGIILMESGRYDEAIATFEALGDYKESASKIPEAKVLKAEQLLSEGKYDEALATFEELAGYQDSASMITECKYQIAVKLIENGNIVDGYEAMYALEDYKDSKTILAEIYDQYRIKKLITAGIGDRVFFGSYEQDNDIANGREDIEWIVLDIQGRKALLISRYCLDCQPFNTQYTYHLTWETSSLREWLNSTFLSSSFSSDDQTQIVIADGSNSKIFLLSTTEANKYFSSNSERACAGTAYCYAQGAHKTDNGNCWWWLRTPGHQSDSVASIVTASGAYGDMEQNISDCAVRPAMWIDTTQIGDTIKFGSYEQDNDTSNGKEDIEWTVLDKQDDKALLISKYCLDIQPFGYNKNIWATSSLRSWLNNEFMYEAFSQEEQKAVTQSSITNSSIQSWMDTRMAGDYNTIQLDNTTDRVFVLSVDEVMNYFKNYSERKATATVYVCQIMGENAESVRWWTRSGIYDAYYDKSGRVNIIGMKGERSSDIIGSDKVAVRPAIWVDISKIG